MFSTGGKTPNVNVLLVGASPRWSASFRSHLERVGCECHFAKSYQEMANLLGHTRLRLDIVLSLDTCQNLSGMMGLLAGLRVSFFHMLLVEEGCWWLPVLQNGEDCLGTAAFRPNEFSYVFAEVVRRMVEDAASGGCAGT